MGKSQKSNYKKGFKRPWHLSEGEAEYRRDTRLLKRRKLETIAQEIEKELYDEELE